MGLQTSRKTSFFYGFSHFARASFKSSGKYSSVFISIFYSNFQIIDAFYSTYFHQILQDILAVLTDSFHKSGFKLQATILMQLLTIVESGKVHVPLFPANSAPDVTNQSYIREFIIHMFASAFPNLNPFAPAFFFSKI